MARHRVHCVDGPICKVKPTQGHCVIGLSEKGDTLFELLTNTKFRGVPMWKGECCIPGALAIYNVPRIRRRHV